MIMFARGCCCNDECEVIATDNFNRSNSSNINTGAPFTWSGDTSGLFISGNKLLFFATVFGRIKCGTPHPTSSSSGVVYCTFGGMGADADTAEVWLNGTDEDNCTVARMVTYTSVTGTLDIRTRIAGVDDVVCSVDFVPGGGGVYTLWLKYDSASGKAEASFVDVSSATYLCTPPYPCAAIAPIGDFAGIAVEDHIDSDISADDFFFYPLSDGADDCPEMPCPDHECTIYEDDFDRADDAGISSGIPCDGWTEVSGAWAIASNKLSCTSAGIVLLNAPAPTGNAIVLTVDYTRSGANRALIIVGWLNSSNYTYLQYIAAGILLRQVVGGVDTQLHSNAFSSTSGGTASVCINEDGDLTASLDGVAQFTYPSLTFAGDQVGLGAELSGTVTFDNFELTRSYTEEHPTCEACPVALPDNCSDCCPGGITRSMIFYWPGGISSPGDCTECNQLSAAQEFALDLPGTCAWVYEGGNNRTECSSGGGGDCCSVADQGSLIITAETLIDTTTDPDSCFVRVRVQMNTCPCPSLNGHEQIDVTFMTLASYGNFMACDGVERDMVQHDEASSLTSYRGNQGWRVGHSNGCAGTFPTTPTIRSA